MSKEKRRVPKLRFPGFTEDWEQRKLGDLLILLKDGSHGTHKNTDAGVYLLSAKNIKNGRINIMPDDRIISWDDYNVIHKNYELQIGDILLTIVGSIGETAIFNLKTKVTFQRSVAFLRPNSNLNNGFLYTLINTDRFQNQLQTKQVVSAQPGIYLGDLATIDITYPKNILEQEKIYNIFREIENSITLHQRKLDNLKLKKKALLQKLFPKNGERYPELRFPGFTDAWEQREFSDIFAEVKSGLSRMLSNDDIGLPVVRANNINDGQLNLVDDIKYWYKNDPQGANTNNYLIEQGDILINFINSEAKMGTAAYVTRRPERDTIYTTNILRCKVNDEYNPYFIYSLTFLNSYKNYIASITKPAVNQASFTTVDFKKYSIKIPTVKEQNQIADLIKTFNKLITLHQRKLDHLQLQKNALLQQMFV